MNESIENMYASIVKRNFFSNQLVMTPGSGVEGCGFKSLLALPGNL